MRSLTSKAFEFLRGRADRGQPEARRCAAFPRLGAARPAPPQCRSRRAGASTSSHTQRSERYGERHLRVEPRTTGYLSIYPCIQSSRYSAASIVGLSSFMSQPLYSTASDVYSTVLLIPPHKGGSNGSSTLPHQQHTRPLCCQGVQRPSVSPAAVPAWASLYRAPSRPAAAPLPALGFILRGTLLRECILKRGLPFSSRHSAHPQQALYQVHLMTHGCFFGEPGSVGHHGSHESPAAWQRCRRRFSTRDNGGGAGGDGGFALHLLLRTPRAIGTRTRRSAESPWHPAIEE